MGDRALGALDGAGDVLVPQPPALQLPHQIGVDLKELAREGLPLEQVGHLGLDALVAPGDRGDRRRWGDGDHQRVAQADPGDAGLEGIPAVGVGRGHAPQVELQVALGGPGFGECAVGTGGLGQRRRSGQGMEVDLLGDASGQHPGLGRVEGHLQLEEHVLEAHQAQPDRAPLGVGVAGRVGGIEVDVDHPVEEGQRQSHHVAQPLKVEGEFAGAVGPHHRRQVDRAQVAHRCLGLVGHLEDLGAQVGQVHHVAGGAGLVALGVGGVLEGHPAVAGLGQAAHHLGVQLTGRNLADITPRRLGLGIGGAELVAVEVDQLGHLLGVEQRPLPVVLHPLHEQVGHPVGDVEVVGPPGGVAGVVLEVEELLDVRVPAFEVDARGALAATALVDRRHRAVEGLEERHDPVGQAIGALDQRAARTDAGERQADATGVLGQAGHVLVSVIDGVE